MKEIIVTPDRKGERLDRFLVSILTGYSRAQIQKAVREGKVLVNNEPSKSGYILKDNDVVHIRAIAAEYAERSSFSYPVPVLYEDEHILVINKPGGITTHPPHPGYEKTVVAALISAGKNLYNNDTLRPGIVHRLDKETSGVMVLAKTPLSYNNLVSQFKSRQVKKEYRAIIHGHLKEGEITLVLSLRRDRRNPLKMKVGFFKAKEAVTRIKVIREVFPYTYVRIEIETGRTHQIRVHLNFIGHPAAGDGKYGVKDGFKHLFLHSYRIKFHHPVSGRSVEFIAPLPEYFNEILYKK